MGILRKTLIWATLTVAGLALVGLGIYFGLTNLDHADKWGSVVGALAALSGLAMTSYGLILSRREAPGNIPQRRSGDGLPRTRDTSPVRQQIKAGRDAYVAGHDQNFGAKGPGQ